MAPNAPLLQQVLTHIETHPADWNQKDWRCGTGGCFAGFTAILTGARWATPDNDPYRSFVIHPVTGERVYVAEYACQVLGLPTDTDYPRLFHMDNTLDDLRRIVAGLIAEAIDAEAPTHTEERV